MIEEEVSFGIPGILECQKNRFPMLFIDRVTECVPGRYAKGFKLFSYNEWFFQGYEASEPKVWNVIQIESMSQMFLMTFLSMEGNRGLVTMSNRFNNVHFFKRISCGERLDLEATLDSFSRGVSRGSVKGYVDGMLACSMDCVIVVPELFPKITGQPKKLTEESVGQSTAKFSPIDFGISKIKDCLLNKYPWLFLDRVLDIKPGKHVVAQKNFTYNEAYFPAHFPGAPSVPGFIQMESCMQCFLLTFLSLDGYKRRETADEVLNNVLIKRQILPGDTLEMHATLSNFSSGLAKGRVESFVDGEAAVSFDVMAVVVDELDKFEPKAGT
jgi:3-hydroxyacyl-[acyl-carrier-protein] dehydratase